ASPTAVSPTTTYHADASLVNMNNSRPSCGGGGVVGLRR
ncbi:hypothetical protein A2U01_0108733, partial [Trifolium medium]|nr:hypothetical protein [Trifolium medium]